MIIGLVCQNFPPASFEGGISHYSLRLAKALAGRGHDVMAISSTEFTRSARESEEIHKLRIRLVQGPWNHLSIREIHKIGFAEKLDALVLQYSPASFRSSFRLAWAITSFPCQKITAFHTLWGGGFDRLFGLSLLAGSDKIIATNSEIMTLLEKHVPLFLKKTYWIPIGSNILSAKCYAKRCDFSQPVISFFGMLYPGKGLSLILDVLQELKERGRPFHFKFIGGGMLGLKSYEDHFQKEIEARGLHDIVEHLGLLPAEEVSAWIQASRFLFLPYDSGLSDRRGSFMAAIAHGKAVLTSPPAIEMPFIKNGQNSLWPLESSVQAYSSLARRLLSDDKLISRLEIGATELRGHFTWERIASEHELVLGQK